MWSLIVKRKWCWNKGHFTWSTWITLFCLFWTFKTRKKLTKLSAMLFVSIFIQIVYFLLKCTPASGVINRLSPCWTAIRSRPFLDTWCTSNCHFLVYSPSTFPCLNMCVVLFLHPLIYGKPPRWTIFWSTVRLCLYIFEFCDTSYGTNKFIGGNGWRQQLCF